MLSPGRLCGKCRSLWFRARRWLGPAVVEPDWAWRGNWSTGRLDRPQVPESRESTHNCFLPPKYLEPWKNLPTPWSLIRVRVVIFILLRYGPATNSKWVLWGHDIFGPLSGANIVLRIRFRFLEFFNVSRRSFVTSALLTSNISGRTMEYCSKMNQDLGVSADSNKQLWEWCKSWLWLWCKCHVKGRLCLEKLINFRKNSKRPLSQSLTPPPHFKTCCWRFFWKFYICICILTPLNSKI